jgi:hypothetical protein
MNSYNCNYNLSDDWGWYIDIESINNTTPNLVYIPNKKISLYINKLDTIEETEDEYDYYMKNQKNLDEMSIKNIDKDINIINLKLHYIFNIGSTTIITALLTYLILFTL